MRLGLAHGFRSHELPALGFVAALLMFFPIIAAPTGFIATLIVSGMSLHRCARVSSHTESAPSLFRSPHLGSISANQ